MPLGIAVMPDYEEEYVLVRDTRGIQMVDIQLNKAHQLCLSALPSLENELRPDFLLRNMLHVFKDEDTWKYTIVTAYQDDAETDINLCAYTLPSEFIHGLKLFAVNKDRLN